MLEELWDQLFIWGLFISFPLYFLFAIVLMAAAGYVCITHVPKDYLAAVKREDGSLRVLKGDNFYWTPFQRLHVFSWLSPFGKRRQTLRYKYVNVFHSVKRDFLNSNPRRTFEILLSIYVQFNQNILTVPEPLALLNKIIIETSDEFFAKAKKSVRLTYDAKSCRKSPYGKILNAALTEAGFAKLRLLQITVKEPQL